MIEIHEPIEEEPVVQQPKEQPKQKQRPKQMEQQVVSSL
jgi:hypothetical protein